MATFECKVYPLVIEDHPNADRLELARVGDFRSIVGKGQCKTGDLGVYIPEAALVPDWLLEEMGLTGKLAGKRHNRVKAAKFRGVLSQGLVLPVRMFSNSAPFGVDHKGYITRNGSGADEDTLFVSEGQNVAEFLGIEKYEPIIPSCMKGEVHNAHGYTLKFDIENIKKHPDVFQDGELVQVTEKIHGTWTCLGYHPDFEEKERYLVTSKGLSEDGLAFKLNEANDRNLYVRALMATVDYDGFNVVYRLRERLLMRGWVDVPVYILGEIYGPGVQKNFNYGLLKPSFRVFDIYVGHPGQGEYMPMDEVSETCDAIGVGMVPVLYTGPYSPEVVERYTSGAEAVSGKGDNIREGIVVRSLTNRNDPAIQCQDSSTPERVILKSLSEEYLLQKGGTEYT